MSHNVAYFDRLLTELRKRHPNRTFSRTRTMEILQQVEIDIGSARAPTSDVAELYRDKIHMNVVTGRYLMHNAMRHALGQPRSKVGFAELGPEMEAYLDSVLDRVLQ